MSWTKISLGIVAVSSSLIMCSFAQAQNATIREQCSVTLLPESITESSAVLVGEVFEGDNCVAPEFRWLEITVRGSVLHLGVAAGPGKVRAVADFLDCGMVYSFQTVWAKGPELVSSPVRQFTTTACKPKA